MLKLSVRPLPGSPYLNAAILTYSKEGASGYVGDHGTSFGAFQLHRGGPGSLGYEFEHDTGLNLADPSTRPAQYAYVRKYVERHGGFSSNVWHGLRHVHPSSRVMPYSGRGGGDKKLEVHVNTHLDGKMVASNVVEHVLKSSEHSRGAAYFDGYHTFAGADRQTSTA